MTWEIVSPPIFQRSLCRIDNISFLIVFWNSPVKPFRPGIFFLGKFLATNWMSFIDVGSFRPFLSECALAARVFHQICCLYLSFRFYYGKVGRSAYLSICTVCTDVTALTPDDTQNLYSVSLFSCNLKHFLISLWLLIWFISIYGISFPKFRIFPDADFVIDFQLAFMH